MLNELDEENKMKITIAGFCATEISINILNAHRHSTNIFLNFHHFLGVVAIH